MKYRIKFDGKWQAVDTMFNRADQAFYGFSSCDVSPPFGMTLFYDPANHYEPRFILKPVCSECGKVL